MFVIFYYYPGNRDQAYLCFYTIPHNITWRFTLLPLSEWRKLSFLSISTSIILSVLLLGSLPPHPSQPKSSSTCGDLWPPGTPCCATWHLSFSYTATHAVYPERLTVASAAHLLPARVVPARTSNLTLIRTCWWCSSSHWAAKDATASASSHCARWVFFFFFSNVGYCPWLNNSQFPPRGTPVASKRNK